MDTYAPALPKVVSVLFFCLTHGNNTDYDQAILGTHGYKQHEEYNPSWRHVEVPQAFLRVVCPMAEANIALIEGMYCCLSSPLP